MENKLKVRLITNASFNHLELEFICSTYINIDGIYSFYKENEKIAFLSVPSKDCIVDCYYDKE